MTEVLRKLFVETPEQRKAVDELREKVRPFAENEDQLRDLYLIRWLVARDWSVDRSADMFKTSMEWRKEYGASEVVAKFPTEDAEQFDNYHSYYPGRITGSTHDGWPVSCERLGAVDPPSVLQKTTEEFRIKYNIWRMELNEAKRKELEEQYGFTAGLTVVTDVSELGWAHYGSAALRMFKMIANVNKNNYPETLRRSFIVNTPVIFTTVWKLLTPFMDPSTLKKTSILGSNYLDALLDVMPIESIPPELGGRGDPLPKGGVYYRPGERPGDGEKFSEVQVGRSSSYTHRVEVKEEDSLIAYEFLTLDYDIKFGVKFESFDKQKKSTVLDTKLVNSQELTVKGEIQVSEPGVYILEWDNSHSWTRGKTLKFYVAQRSLSARVG